MTGTSLPTQVHRYALDAGINTSFALSGVRAVLVQFIDAATGALAAPTADVSLSLDHGAPLRTRQASVNFQELSGSAQLLIRAPALSGFFVRVVLSASPTLVEVG